MNQNDLLAVVVLKEPKKHIIVPEKYIYGLDQLQGQLKTWGVNSKVNHRVFWKRSFLDDNVIPDSNDEPNFQLTLRDDFPPPPEIDSACYIARVKRFYKNEAFVAAKNYCDKFRPMLPAVYFDVRTNQPVPPEVPSADEEEYEFQYDTSNLSTVGESDELPENIETVANIESKPMLTELQMNASDILAIDELIEEANSRENSNDDNGIDRVTEANTAPNEIESAIVSGNEANPLVVPSNVECSANGEENPVEINAQPNSNVVGNIDSSALENSINGAQMNNDEWKEVTEKIDDDIEITFIVGQNVLPVIKSKPMIPKLDDKLSGNMPYQGILDLDDKEIERQYKVKVGDQFELVKLKKRLVDFLTRMNVECRNEVSADKIFVKGLVIGVFSVEKVKATETLIPDKIAFIKDLFAIRVENNENRILSFDALMSTACDEIRQMRSQVSCSSKGINRMYR